MRWALLALALSMALVGTAHAADAPGASDDTTGNFQGVGDDAGKFCVLTDVDATVVVWTRRDVPVIPTARLLVRGEGPLTGTGGTPATINTTIPHRDVLQRGREWPLVPAARTVIQQ